MACDRYNSSSWIAPNSSLPDFTSNYTLNSSARLSWRGDAPYRVDQSSIWRLILGWFSDDNADSAESNSHSTAITAGSGWTFNYGASGNPFWVKGSEASDDEYKCGFSSPGMYWDIPIDFNISSNQKFKIFAINVTDPSKIITKTSPGFLLLPVTVSSTSSSVSTAASHSSNGTSQTSPNPSDIHITGASTATSTRSATPGPKPSGLSSGAKAGIGVSCTLVACSILLGVFFFFRERRRQQPAYKTGPFSFRKPELDGKAAAERHELDEQHGISEMMEARITTPVEMPG
ncbi:hypothetical protein MMC22_003535 [Lobaria immixta]|nr:hypothetical protein [Lobaria immixta]